MAASGTNRSGGDLALEGEMERLRPSLTGYCYRMLGSGFEAEDATQETLLRAWRRSDTLADRAALKSWLFSIATNVCLDQIDARKRRARPVDLADPGTAVTEVGGNPAGVVGLPAGVVGLPEGVVGFAAGVMVSSPAVHLPRTLKAGVPNAEPAFLSAASNSN